MCRGAPEESGPTGVTLLNLIGETKLTNALNSNSTEIMNDNRTGYCVSNYFNEKFIVKD